MAMKPGFAQSVEASLSRTHPDKRGALIASLQMPARNGTADGVGKTLALPGARLAIALITAGHKGYA